ncbi:MAG: hypothetical protein LUC91_06210 [Prevotella sp.]|nr:hypothetical protein [Prevotella sp.]
MGINPKCLHGWGVGFFALGIVALSRHINPVRNIPHFHIANAVSQCFQFAPMTCGAVNLNCQEPYKGSEAIILPHPSAWGLDSP